jgi:hypothetical protein
VEPDVVVFDAPRLNLPARVVEIEEPVLVQALVRELPLKAFDEALSTGFPGRVVP